MRRRKPKLIYFNHSTLLVLNEAATRRSNRLLGLDADLVRQITCSHDKMAGEHGSSNNQ